MFVFVEVHLLLCIVGIPFEGLWHYLHATERILFQRTYLVYTLYTHYTHIDTHTHVRTHTHTHTHPQDPNSTHLWNFMNMLPVDIKVQKFVLRFCFRVSSYLHDQSIIQCNVSAYNIVIILLINFDHSTTTIDTKIYCVYCIYCGCATIKVD